MTVNPLTARLVTTRRLILKMSFAVSSFLILYQIASELSERDVVINYSRRQLEPDSVIPLESLYYDEKYPDDERTTIVQTMHNKLHIGDYNRTSLENLIIKNKKEMLIDIERSESNHMLALFKKLVIVTAITQDNLGEAEGMIASAQKHMPKIKIIVYDLGLTSDGANKVRNMCNVETRRFPFQMYPDHVKNVHTYAWRPLVIKETINEFGVIFYGDSSVRFQRSLRLLFPYLKLNHGFIPHIHDFNPLHVVSQIDTQTFKELKVERSTYINDIGLTPWISAGRVLYVNSSFIQKHIIAPMVNCTLRSECISPKGARHDLTIAPNGVKRTHGVDSSVLSLLVYKNIPGFYNARHNNTQLFDQVVSITGEFQTIPTSVRLIRNRPHC